MTEQPKLSIPEKWKRRALVGMRLVLALIFAASGLAKLLYAPLMVLFFTTAGLGREVMVLIALTELVGAVLLLVPATALLGAGLVSMVAWGAVYMHLALIGGSPIPALCLALLADLIVWDAKKRDDFAV